MTTSTITGEVAATTGRVDRDVARAIARLRPAGSWTEQGSCRTADPEIFYSSDDAIFAKGVCAGCPVIDQCLAWALESREPHGVWGGLDEQERKQLTLPNTIAARRRREALAAARQRASANSRQAKIPRAPRKNAEEPDTDAAESTEQATRRELPRPSAPAPAPAAAGTSPARTIPGMLSRAQQGAPKLDPALAVTRAKSAGTPVIVRVVPRYPAPGIPDPRRPLSDREIEVLAGLASGKEREKAAADLGISAATFKTHIGRITAKLGSNGGSGHTVALGYAYGYLLPDPLPLVQRPDVSERPLEALCHLAAGLSNSEIAKAMFLVEDTVKTHLRRLMKRFEVGTRAALVDRAMRCGLLLAVLGETQVRR